MLTGCEIRIKWNSFVRFFRATDGEFWQLGSEPKECIGTSDRVIALGYYSAKVQKTGKTFSAKFAHIKFAHI